MGEESGRSRGMGSRPRALARPLNLVGRWTDVTSGVEPGGLGQSL